jgi:peptidyl-prolyl cis-trans isomerase B (cyclophilin B)
MKKLLLLTSLLFLNVAFAANPVVVMETSSGVIEIELFEDKAPNTVANFLKYVDSKFYDGTIFHRVINNFMIQGGGFNQKMEEKQSGTPIKNEANNRLSNDTGTIAMARTNDPHSATAQFFINVADNSSLNHTGENNSGWGYAVFGKVTNGMHVVNRIKMVKTGNVSGYADVPMDAVIIKSVKRKTSGEAKVEPKVEAKPVAKPKTKAKKKAKK